jgi:hypothetical protein
VFTLKDIPGSKIREPESRLLGHPSCSLFADLELAKQAILLKNNFVGSVSPVSAVTYSAITKSFGIHRMAVVMGYTDASHDELMVRLVDPTGSFEGSDVTLLAAYHFASLKLFFLSDQVKARFERVQNRELGQPPEEEADQEQTGSKFHAV